jgi:hypothetical protein
MGDSGVDTQFGYGQLHLGEPQTEVSSNYSVYLPVIRNTTR